MHRVILVVDDEDEPRGALAALLRRESYAVHEAADAHAALQVLHDQPDIRLVISDHNMPGMPGLEFLKIVRERHPEVVRIMLTGDPDPQTIIRSVNEGEVYRFIKKPWDNITVRVMVYFAFETIQLQEENRRLLQVLHRREAALRDLQDQFPALREKMGTQEDS